MCNQLPRLSSRRWDGMMSSGHASAWNACPLWSLGLPFVWLHHPSRGPQISESFGFFPQNMWGNFHLCLSFLWLPLGSWLCRTLCYLCVFSLLSFGFAFCRCLGFLFNSFLMGWLWWFSLLCLCRCLWMLLFLVLLFMVILVSFGLLLLFAFLFSISKLCQCCLAVCPSIGIKMVCRCSPTLCAPLLVWLAPLIIPTLFIPTFVVVLAFLFTACSSFPFNLCNLMNTITVPFRTIVCFHLILRTSAPPWSFAPASSSPTALCFIGLHVELILPCDVRRLCRILACEQATLIEIYVNMEKQPTTKNIVIEIYWDR